MKPNTLIICFAVLIAVSAIVLLWEGDDNTSTHKRSYKLSRDEARNVIKVIIKEHEDFVDKCKVYW